MEKFRELLRTTPFRIVLAVFGLILLGVVYYFISVPVKTGKKVVCRYKHTISDQTYTLRIPKSLADRFKVEKETSICERHKKAEALYAQAQNEIAAKKYSKAKKTLKEVQKLDPKFKKTESQISAIDKVESSTGGGKTSGGSSGTSGGDSGGTSPPGTSGGNGTSPGGTPDTNTGGNGGTGGGTAPVPIDLAALLPQVDVPGYSRGTLLESGNSAQIDYLPSPSTRGTASSLLITVRNMDSADKAKNFIENTSKIAWPNNQKQLSIRDNKAYFGTNIYGYANLSWPNDVVVYEVQMLSAKATPEKLYSDIVKIADYLP